MTQAELPQIPIARYLDLLKRRRWQLLPAALLGLAVGTLVAWLIPRYYVAETIVRILPRTVDKAMSRQDRFLEEIRKARVVIKNEALVATAIRELEWPAANDPEDTASLRAQLAEIADRIEVSQMDAGESSTSSALLSITYRDRDGPRSAQFLNTLRDLYLEREFSAILRAEKRRLAELTSKEARHSDALDRAFNSRREILRRSGLNPGYRFTQQGALRQQDLRLDELRRVESDIEALRASIEGLGAKLRLRRQSLDKMDPKKLVDPDRDPRVRNLLGEFNQSIKRVRSMLKNQPETSSVYQTLSKQLRSYEERREEAIQRLKDNGTLSEVNPDYTALQQEIEILSAELVGQTKELELRSARFEILDNFRKELPDFRTSLAKADARIEEEQRQLSVVHDRQLNQAEKVSQIELNRRDVVDVLRPAWTPPEPTYPNKFLIAILGAILGFGTAVGLIFFLDLAQPTFKSFDEVSRGLPVTALGGVSYLELEEDVRESKRKRFRIGAFLIFVVLLIVSVLAIYIVAPVRLPAWLRDFFDLVFQRAA